METSRWPRRGARHLPWFVLFILLALAARAQADPAVVGQWSSVVSWPIVSIHASLMSNGKLLMWGRDGGNLALTWDPASNAFLSVPLQTTDLFCSGHAHLSNGRLLVTGGVVVGPGGEMDGVGEIKSNIFNPGTNSWNQKANMNAGRWYPTNCALANGEVLVAGGNIDNTVGENPIPQVWQTGGGWRTLSAASQPLPVYPFLHLSPNGQVFNSGPNVTTRYLNTAGNGTWTTVQDRPSNIFRDYGSSVLYDNGKVLVLGGGDPPVATGEVIDLNQPSPQWRPLAATMTYARRQFNALLLPDGTVLITGGTSGSGFNDACGAVLPRMAELWDPASETFTPLASASEIRIYHSTTVLLPDGRVFSGGSGQAHSDTCNDQDHYTTEFYSPPYLFKGARPVIKSAPSSVHYGNVFTVKTAQSQSISKVTWLKLSSVTHSFNQDQRINRLSFTRTSNGLNVTAPSNPNLCPPGDYMLFILNSAGVPSVATFISIS